MNQFHQMQKGREGGFLRTACDVGLILSGVIWAAIQLGMQQLALPTGGGALDWVSYLINTSVAITLALGCAVVLPALIAIVFPFTPAGQLLQEVRRSTWGFLVMIAAMAYLIWYGHDLFLAYWSGVLAPTLMRAMPEMAERQTITTMILAIIVPALAFSWSSPLAWLAEVQQAHLVKKVRLQQAADLAMLKTHYLWAVDKLRVGLANLTAAESAQVMQTMGAMQVEINRTLKGLSGTFRTLAGVELAAPTMDDQHIVQTYGQLADMLDTRVLDVAEHDAYVAAARDSYVAARAIDPSHPAHVDSRLEPSIPRDGHDTQHDATARHGIAPRAAEYDAARERLGTVDVWTAKTLADVLKTAESTARETINDWKRAELLDETRLGRYRFRDTQVVRL